jgi:DNA-binding transcriptional regulator YdaS (Cro superfamily)
MGETIDIEARRKGANAAIKAVGTIAGLADKLRLTKGAVWQWRRNGIPADRLAEVAAATGIPAAELRPDLAKTFGVERTPERTPA